MAGVYDGRATKEMVLRDRGGLAAAIMVVAALGVAVLGLLAATLPGLFDTLPGVVARLRHLPAVTPEAARAGQLAIEAAAVAVVIAAAAALPCGLAFSVLPPGLAWLGRALLAVPAWALAFVVALTAVLLLGTSSDAISGAWAAIHPVGPRTAATLLWLPIFSARVEIYARHVDAAQARMLAGLGVSPLGRLWRLTLPAVAWPLFNAAAIAFAVTAIGFGLVGRGISADQPGIGPTAVALALIAAPLWAWLSRPR